MSYLGSSIVSTEEYGLIEVERLHKYNLPCKVLALNKNTNSIDFQLSSGIETETRNASYIISTFKYNRIIVSPDQLIYCNQEWKTPKEIQIGEEIWIGETRMATTDAITDIILQYKSSKMYNIIVDNAACFVNKFLLLNIND